MQCYLVRHRQAADADGWSGADADRPLTARGRTRMERAATAIAALDLEIDAIVASPLLRAQQTATIVARALHRGGQVVTDARLGARFGPGVLNEILLDHGDAEHVMLVGHEPGMSRTVEALCGGTVAFKPGTIACLELARHASARGMLLWLAPPALLASVRPV